MEKYLETFELSREEMLKGLSAGVQNGVITPVTCVSAAQNIGAQITEAVRKELAAKKEAAPAAPAEEAPAA